MNVTVFIFAFILLSKQSLFAQEQPHGEQQLEDLAMAEQDENEEDSWLQEMERYRRQPLNLNLASEIELADLRILSPIQVNSFLSYRKRFGDLGSIYELQAVPYWDIPTIKKIIPYVTLDPRNDLRSLFAGRLKNGDHSLIIRISQVFERSKGYGNDSIGAKYQGSAQRLFFRYRYQLPGKFYLGLLGDKDAGEQFFRGAQARGFDFYSFHLFIRGRGVIRSLALGDYSVNLGQGLIQWQSLAFRKTSLITAPKRQSAVLKPYHSAGEYNFHRGAGLTSAWRKLEITAFASVRKLTANLDADSLGPVVTSISTSGNHRTIAEIMDRNNLRQLAAGGNIKYNGGNWHAGMSVIHHRFDKALKKKEEPANLYAIDADEWRNLSFDYSYTYRNLHVFGEAAMDKKFNKAFVNSILVSVDPRVDISIVQRSIAREYRSINGNAFTENLEPNNETGWYAGMSVRPSTSWILFMYVDVYRFSWLRARADAPSSGKDFLLQISYAPSRKFEIYSRYRIETKSSNENNAQMAMNHLFAFTRQHWRVHCNFHVKAHLLFRWRTEILWHNKKNGGEEGYLVYADLLYRPKKPLTSNFRLMYFETGGFDSRVYAYENDVLYYSSVPGFFDKGYRAYINISYDLSRQLSCWLKIAASFYHNKKSIGSGDDEIAGNRKTEMRLLVRLNF